MTKNELLAVLKAYKQAIDVASPGLHPDMAAKHLRWPNASAEELGHDLARYLVQASVPSCSVRVFFKTGRDFVYGGCNKQFAADAGLSSAEEIVGLEDFDARISWVAQAAKYRSDDRDVVAHGLPKLGIIERQSSASGIVWLDTSKVPILDGDRPIGVFGTYEVIDAKTAARRSAARQK